jgi:succinoglycan biosynthesis protein ExoV
MEILYYRDPAGNFGDDLNAVLWRELLPPQIFDVEDVLLMGIGSIFNAHCAPLSQTRGKKMFVLGSGAGYGPLPLDWDRWNLLAFRGPLTAELVGRPDLAVTDSAALVSLLPGLLPSAPQRDSILFIPHYNSVAVGQWKRVACEAGMTFVDPRWPVPQVMEYFSRAKLVVTEAMHGAVVADALRIPWIPISIAPDALPFKWWDWALSLNMTYEPIIIPPSSLWESLHHKLLMREAKANGLVASAFLADSRPASLISDFKKRYKPLASDPVKWKEERINPSRRLRSLVRSMCSCADGTFIERAARHLRKAALTKPFLSRDAIFQFRVDQLHGLLKCRR